MMSFNWIDLIIILVTVLAVVGGLRIGFVRLVASIVSFFGTLYLVGTVIPYLLWFIRNPTTLSIVAGNIVLGLGLIVPFYVDKVAIRLQRRLREGKKLRYMETAFGVALSLGSSLIFVWLCASAVGRLPFEGLSNSVNDSVLIRELDDRLPSSPLLFARFGRLIDPNLPPLAEFTETFNDSRIPQSPEVERAFAKAEKSAARVTGFGCGGIVSGSGYVVGPDLIMTNAHVVAGVSRPIVKLNERSYEARPVYFNPSLDVAILRVNNLPVEPLVLVDGYAAAGSTIAIIGYTEGNLDVIAGNLGDTFTVTGRNIYDLGAVRRETYLLSAGVRNGNSGAPVVLESGHVVGMLFARVDGKDNTALALTSKSLIAFVEQAEGSKRSVGTGFCTN
jgi:S1-C subfamily serine protease